MTKTKIVLDADVIIHFSKADCLNILPHIFPTYQFVILDIVYEELPREIKIQVDNQINFLKSISLLALDLTSDQIQEFAILCKRLGKGESACVVYCKYNNDVVGSSNLKDIAEYCRINMITYLTTSDFLYFALKNEILTFDQVDIFVNIVRSKGSIMPYIDFHTYVCNTPM